MDKFISKELNDFQNHTFDFDNQHKTTYDDWVKSFEKAIAKRAEPNCFLGMSSGYDSGAIACALLKLGIPFKAYIFKGLENQAILKEREKLVNYEYFTTQDEVWKILKDKINNKRYTIKYEGKVTDMRILDDGGAKGVGTIAKLGKEDNGTVCLSGQGADEILSDYAQYQFQSELKGIFPEKLKEWYNFKDGCNYSYMMKEDEINKVFDTESRYPYLDIDLVQEFLWLTPELKNKHYKAPLRHYLKTNNFPFKEGIKIGFSVEI